MLGYMPTEWHHANAFGAIERICNKAYDKAKRRAVRAKIISV